MAISKSVEMALKISAIADLAGLNQLKTGLQGIDRTISGTIKRVGKLAAAGAAIALGWKGVETVGKFFGGMKEQADAAQRSSEALRLSVSRSKEGMEGGAEATDLLTGKFRDLARGIESEGLLAAQAMETGFARMLTAGFGSEKIVASAKGLEGMVIALRGVKASADDVGDVTQRLRNFIKGTALLPREFNAIMDASDKAKNSFKKLSTETARAEFVQGLMDKQAWRTGAALETSAGQAAKTEQTWDALQRTLGEPFLETQRAFNEVMGELGKALQPVAKEIADVLTPAMKDFADWIRDNKGLIKDLGNVLRDAFKWVMENWGAVSTGLTAVGIALGLLALATPIGATAAAITGLGAAVTLAAAYWPEISTAASQMWSSVSGTLGEATGWVKSNFAEPIKEATRSVWEPAIQGASELGGRIQSELAKAWKTGDIKGGLQGIVNAFREFDWSGLAASIGEGFTKIDWGTVFEATGALIGKGFGNALKFGLAAIGGIGKFISEGAVDVDWGATLAGVASAMGRFFKGLGGELSKAIGEAFAGIDWSALMPGWVKDTLRFLGLIPKDIEAIDPALAETKKKEEEVKQEAQAVATAISNWEVNPALLGQMEQVSQKAKEVKAAISSMPAGSMGSSAASWGAFQAGGIVRHPTMATIGERGPEAVIPLQRSMRSRGLLATAADALGMRGRGRGGGGEGPTNITVSPVITINGAPAGQEGAVAREIERAMQDPIQRMLEQLRRARDEERRLAYV